MDKYKARLRAWLVELVREAIRIERIASEVRDFQRVSSHVATGGSAISHTLGPIIGKARDVAANTHQTIVDTSFDQIQAEALKSMEDYYAKRNESVR